MEILLKDSWNFNFKIKDFCVDPTNNKIITTGDRLIFLKDNKKLKELSGRVKKCDIIQYVKNDDQLFISTNFFVSTENGKVFEADSNNNKLKKKIFDLEKSISLLNITTNGNIIYIHNNNLCLFKHNTMKMTSVPLVKDALLNHKIFISEQHVILKYRAIKEKCNIIEIYATEHLNKIRSFKTDNNHIFSTICELYYYAGTTDGELEIWDIIKEELYDSKKICDEKITYININNNQYYIGTENGRLIILDSKFNKIKEKKIFKSEIMKICITNGYIYLLAQGNKIAKLEIVNDENTNKLNQYITNFLIKYNINNEYREFFSLDKVIYLENHINELKDSNNEFAPLEENIFKALSDPISNRKVCIFGKDPYYQKGVATGLAFEVNNNNWNSSDVNTSLKNILKLIFKTYTNKLADINDIRNEINNKTFDILPPNQLFKSWKKQGVLLLNSALTTEINSSGKHHKLWNEFTIELIKYISSKNKNIIYLLWGKDAMLLEKYITNGNIIKHNHPAICGKLDNEKDFLNGKSFEDTKNIINWLGV